MLYAQRQNERRETLIEDRTKCHADHVGQGLHRCTTAAVALLKAVEFGDRLVGRVWVCGWVGWLVYVCMYVCAVQSVCMHLCTCV